MIDRVIIALDGSALSQAALEHGAHIAESAGVGVHVLHATERMGTNTVPVMHGDLVRAAAAIGNGESLCQARGVAVEVGIIDGQVVDHLACLTSSRDLIVVGLRGHRARLGIGSTARWLIQHAPCPVMVVGAPFGPQPDRVMVLEGHACSGRSAAFARDLAAQAQWSLEALPAPVGTGRDGAPRGHALDVRDVAAALGEPTADPGCAVLVTPSFPESWFEHLSDHIAGEPGGLPVVIVP